MKRADRRQYITLVGLPGSGKSVIVDIINKLLNTEIPLTVLSTDNHIERVAQAKRQTYNDVFEDTITEATTEMHAARDNAFDKMHHIIHDQTNLTTKKRRGIISAIPEFYVKSAIVLDIDERIRQHRLAQRPGKVIPPNVDASMQSSFTIPTKDEGWDNIFHGDEVLQHLALRAKNAALDAMPDPF